MNVRDVRVNHSGGAHAEYCLEVLYRWPTIKKTVSRWELWRRYSEFAAVNAALRDQYGFNMNSCAFPRKKVFGNLDPGFLRERAGELDAWLQSVLGIDGVAEFSKPHKCSKELKFLTAFDQNCKRAPVEAASVAGGTRDREISKERERRYRRNAGQPGRRRQPMKRRGRPQRAGRAKPSEAAAQGKAAAAPQGQAVSAADVSSSRGAGTGAGSAGPAAPMTTDPRVAKFQKMLALGVPRPAVEQKMRAEGMDVELLGGGGGSGSGGASPPPAPRPPPPAMASGLLGAIRAGKKLKASIHKTRDRSAARI
jgi:hypothetical protein